MVKKDEAQIRLVLLHLRALYPDADPLFLREAVRYHVCRGNTMEQITRLVSEKLSEPSSLFYPTIVPRPAHLVADTGRAGLSRSAAEDVDWTATRNRDLMHLAEMFPSANMRQLRYCIAQAPHSPLYHAVNKLLPLFEGSSGRKALDIEPRFEAGVVEEDDSFRPPEYTALAHERLRADFPSIWQSSIRAILAENNYRYLPARESLMKLTSERSWIGRATHALWQSVSGTARPRVRIDPGSLKRPSALRKASKLSKGSPKPEGMSAAQEMLDREIGILELPMTTEGIQEDHKMALRLLCEDATRHGKLLECGSCFDTVPFELLACCAGGHLFCLECLDTYVNSLVYGQSRLQSTGRNGGGAGRGSGVRCMSTDDCHAYFTAAELQRALSPNTHAVWEARLQEDVLSSLEGLLKHSNHRRQDGTIPRPERIVRCPDCGWAAIADDAVLLRLLPSLTNESSKMGAALTFLLALTALPIIITTLFLLLTAVPDLLVAPSPLATSYQRFNTASSLSPELLDPVIPLFEPIKTFHGVICYLRILGRVCLARRSQSVLRCGNTSAPPLTTAYTYFRPSSVHSLERPIGGVNKRNCGKITCLVCFKAYTEGHRCDSDAGDSMRLAVERAQAEAVMRTCPYCDLRFTKLDGCNKMTCRCGHKMCFLCRKDLDEEGYAHFCNHFQPIPGQACNQCAKCSLYRDEDTAGAVRAAAQRAREAWLAEHPDTQSQAPYLRNLGTHYDFRFRLDKLVCGVLDICLQ